MNEATSVLVSEGRTELRIWASVPEDRQGVDDRWVLMGESDVRTWTFMTNHAHVMVCIAEDPDMRSRDIADRVGISERAVQSIVVDLVRGGYVVRQRAGRRNHYTINPDGRLRHPLEHEHTVGELLAMLGRGLEG